MILHISGVGEPYVIQLFAEDGLSGPSVTPKSRSEKLYYFPTSACPPGGMCASAETAAYNLPEVSISRTRVYFLDGETEVRSLAIDGTVQTVMNLIAPANTQVVFAVSPDDSRIAVAAITLATSNVAASFNEVMYVEDTGTGAHRADIYSSTTKAEWPVAWHAGQLVVGVGPADIGSYDQPYGAIGYHVVDPATGRRLAAMDCSAGLLSSAGTACVSGFCATAQTCGVGMIGAEGFDGSKKTFVLPPGSPPRILTGFASAAELSPDGSVIAASVLPTDSSQTSDDTIDFSDGSSKTLSHLGPPLGWLDGTHVVVGGGFRAYVVDTADPSSVLTLTNTAEVASLGFASFAGALPTDKT